jgi:hypothetical protein
LTLTLRPPGRPRQASRGESGDKDFFYGRQARRIGNVPIPPTAAKLVVESFGMSALVAHFVFEAA